MKSLILITVLAALAVCHDAASIPEDALLHEEGLVYREDIAMYQKGDARLRDIMFHEHIFNLPGVPNVAQRQDIVYRGNSTTRITSVRMNRLPSPPGYTYVGELGTTHISIRVTSAPGEGIFSTFQIWGHYTDWV